MTAIEKLKQGVRNLSKQKKTSLQLSKKDAEKLIQEYTELEQKVVILEQKLKQPTKQNNDLDGGKF